jgi:circadian clock protein KaiC
MKKSRAVAAPARHLTGIPGLDDILGGGLFRGGIYIISGPPGVGKTILGNHACFAHASRGGRALYVTLLAETHAQMLSYMRGLAFYDHPVVGDALRYISAYKVIEAEGLEGLLKLLRQSVREQRCDLLIIDGVMTAEAMATSALAYKRFVHELQTWVSVVGCTVLLLTSSVSELGTRILPAHTMVDGILELRTVPEGMRVVRQLAAVKFRGGEVLEGFHSYRITGAGLQAFPRLEAAAEAASRPLPDDDQRLSSGVAGLDLMVAGGYAPGSTTLLFGSSGSGKTLLGLHFLDEGARRGEACLYFGFFERPDVLRAKARRLGLLTGRGKKAIDMMWQPPYEGLIDELAQMLLKKVDERGVTRLVIDGLVGFKESADYPPRIGRFFSALRHELTARGVTTLLTEETRELVVREITIPAPGVSAVFDNIIFVRLVEENGRLNRLISIMKTRDSDHDHALRRFQITDAGIVIGDEYSASQSIMGGYSEGARSPR